ncbi:drug resistance transporter, EmrB/QacA subfamily [Paenibacillus sp. UNC496MF]|uniref:MDR family MFS transporter n=1 Tax=Paenibacillus sp. UNC496MF TaxID=1502753 RepID=UPI0008E8EB3A|nr:MDR family MFS transporter [Paenibacillus sp. UNC496MF]SFI37512.1 drug resistance transporter, EmrB/QacA subfamily [Paenibacillus sp. UNC496MF]
MTSISPRQVRWIVTGLMLGLLLGSLDQTIVSTAMPHVIAELNGFNLYSWVFTIYMLTSTTAVPIFGKLADLFGRRLVYLIGMGLFLIGSALCGLSHDMTQLIVFRAIQGIGAGALMPIAMTIIGDIFPPDRRGKMQGIFGAVFGLSSVIGPAVGGFIVDHLAWQWIFYINLPFGIFAAIILSIALKESKSDEKKAIDWGGAATLTGAIVAFLLAIEMGGSGGSSEGGMTHYAWSSPQILGLFGASLVLILLFLWIESKVKEPIIPLKLFGNRAISVSSIVGFLMGMGMFGAITYIPLFSQAVIGTSASNSGYILTPLMLSLILSSIIGGRLIMKLSYRTIVMTSMAIMTVGYLFMSQMTVNTSSFELILYMIIIGFGMGALMPVLTIAAQSAVGHELRGVATSTTQFTRSIGGTVGVAIMGVMMSSKMTDGIGGLQSQFKDIPEDQLSTLANPQALLQPEVKAQVPPKLLEALQHILSNAVTSVFVIGIVVVVIGLISAFFFGKLRMPKRQEGAAPMKVEAEMM